MVDRADEDGSGSQSGDVGSFRRKWSFGRKKSTEETAKGENAEPEIRTAKGKRDDKQVKDQMILTYAGTHNFLKITDIRKNINNAAIKPNMSARESRKEDDKNWCNTPLHKVIMCSNRRDLRVLHR